MTTPALTPITHRELHGETDAMRLRQLLIDSYTLTGREFNWEPRRWEGSFWCVTDAERADPAWGAHTHIWEANGAMIGPVTSHCKSTRITVTLKMRFWIGLSSILPLRMKPVSAV